MTTPAVIDSMQSIIDGVDHVATAMERKWGVGRLRLLVEDELREKFDRAARKLNEAIFAYDLDETRIHGPAMIRGWQALDRRATELGHQPIAPVVWETRLADGSVAAIVRTATEAHAVALDGRQGQIWTLDEIARLIDRWPEVGAAKTAFPGALVTDVRHRTPAGDLNDDLPWGRA